MAVDRYIGIDFGTSTSVIRVKRYENGEPVGDRLRTEEFKFSDNATIAPTLIRKKNENGEPLYFGSAAKSTGRKYPLFQNFKTDLESVDIQKRCQARRLTEEFFCYLAKTYESQSEGGYLGAYDDKECTIVSYPVKWSEETRQFMIEAARKAGFPNVSSMDEAQAAIQAVTVMSEDHLRKNGFLKNGVASNILLIDMGAGTTDLVLCRYTPGKNAKTETLCTWPKDGKILFGGKEVDGLLQDFFRDYMKKDDLNRVLKAVGVDQFKSWKEETVSPALVNKDDVSDFSTLDMYVQALGIDMDEYCLNRVTFEKCLEDYLKQLPKLINGCIDNSKITADDVDLVIVTGGHSQWYFVQEMLAGKMPQYGKLELTKVITDPARIIQIARPQETVALGLVYTPLCGKEIVNPEDLYQQGLELEKSDPEKANELYLQAAELGHAGAMNRLGYNCKFGIGTTKDFEKAILWYQKAADLGYATAMYNLGVCHANGTGVLKNAEKAVEWCQKAADLGFAGAMTWLGVCYQKGEGVSKNLEKANGLYQKAAELGEPKAMNNLGYNLIYGYQGTPVNARLGLEWMRKAADLGHERAKKYTEYTPESDFSIEEQGNNCIITKYKGNATIVNVPPYIRGRKVVKIGDSAFRNTRERGFFERIGNDFDEHFESLSQVEIVILPSGVTDLEHSAFYKCKKLRLLVAPGVRIIHSGAFWLCSNLNTIILGQNLVRIMVYAFWGCNGLEKLDFGEGTTEQGIVYFPNSMQCIEGEAFSTCPLIKKIMVSKSTEIKNDSFRKSCTIHYYND